MAGRNSKPKNTGPAGHPGRLDQFGDRLGEDTAESVKNEANDGVIQDCGDDRVTNINS
jgi:hypothetical protein